MRNRHVLLLRARPAVKIVAVWAPLGFAQDPPCVVLRVRRRAVHPHSPLPARTQLVVLVPLLFDPPALVNQLFDRPLNVRILWSLSGTGPQGIHGAETIRSYARSPTAAVAGISPGLAEEVQRVVWELAGVSPDELGALVRLADLRHPDPGAGGKEDVHPRFLGAAEHRACRPQLLRVEFDTQILADLLDRGRRGGLPEVYVPSGQAELAAGSAQCSPPGAVDHSGA